MLGREKEEAMDRKKKEDENRKIPKKRREEGVEFEAGLGHEEDGKRKQNKMTNKKEYRRGKIKNKKKSENTGITKPAAKKKKK